RNRLGHGTSRKLRTHCGQSHALSPLRRAIHPAAFASSRLPKYEPQSNQAIRTFSSLCAALSHASCSASRSAPILNVSIPIWPPILEWRLQTRMVTVKSWRAAPPYLRGVGCGSGSVGVSRDRMRGNEIGGAFYCPPSSVARVQV